MVLVLALGPAFLVLVLVILAAVLVLIPVVLIMETRKLCYRKDDRAMHLYMVP